MTAVTASGTGGADPHAPARSGRGDEAFTRAQRSSRRVRWLKIWLPALAVVGVVGFVGWNYLSMPSISGVSLEGAAITDGKLVMANPKLDGFTKDKLPYSMTAVRAVQELSDTNVIRLEGIDAKLPVDPTNTAKVVAKSGTYDNASNTLVIDSQMTVTTTDGMTANLNSANLDMNAGTMSTQDPVEIDMNGSRITAMSMNMSGNGSVIVFERRVRVDIDPKQTSGNPSGGTSDAVK